jgi:hypothetical protein
MPNRDSYIGSLALLSLGKLINQLDNMVFGFVVLAVVLVIAVRVRLVTSATLASSIPGVTGTMEY